MVPLYIQTIITDWKTGEGLEGMVSVAPGGRSLANNTAICYLHNSFWYLNFLIRKISLVTYIIAGFKINNICKALGIGPGM